MSSYIFILLFAVVQSNMLVYRASDAAVRKRYVQIVEDVQQKGAEVLIFSSMHESGQRTLATNPVQRVLSHRPFAELNQLTGIAAILTFPLDVEVVEAEELEAKEEEERRKLAEANEEGADQS